MERVRVGVVGTGVLGRYHARLYAQLPEADLVGVYDARPEAAALVAAEFGTRAFGRLDDLADAVQALSLAVPASLHYAAALGLLRRRRHLLIEKPLATSVVQAREIVTLAREAGLVLAVGHVERFNPALAILAGLDRPPRYLEAHRLMPCPPLRPGLPRRGSDVGVVLDLMIHDIDLALALVGEPVTEVSGTAHPVVGSHEDFAAARLVFAGGCAAQFTASRIHPEVCRTWLVHAGDRQYHLDLVRGTGTIAVPGPDGMLCTEPLPPTHNALEEELRDFCRCVQGAAVPGGPTPVPRVPGEAALQAVEVAERILAACRR